MLPRYYYIKTYNYFIINESIYQYGFEKGDLFNVFNYINILKNFN